MVHLAVLLGSLMLAATAAAEEHSQSPLCRPLEQRVGKCQTIGVSASAAGGALNLLRKDYLVVPIEQTAADVFPSHLVIGPAELNDSQVIALLKRSYGVGKTVAIVGATADQAGRFHRLLRPGEGASCRPAKGQARIALYGLQRSRYRVPPQNASYCLLNLDPRAAADRQWLRERFGPTPPEPAVGDVAPSAKLVAQQSSAAQFFLTDLATATHCSIKGQTNPPNGTQTITGAIESDLYVYAARDFTDGGCKSCKDLGADYYLVLDDLTYSTSVSSVNQFFVLAPGLAEAPLNNFYPITSSFVGLPLSEPPTTTSYESGYSETYSETMSGSIGIAAPPMPLWVARRPRATRRTTACPQRRF
jgi:hypothetical protein